MSANKSADSDAIRVCCRFRPLNKREKERGDAYIPKFFKENDQQVKFLEKTYNFDYVFPSETTQEQLYNSAAKPIVADVLQGFNGTIFAYGQTSAGKTHSMEGLMHNQELRGVIPRIVSDIFEYIYQFDESVVFHIQISYFEIYLDKIRDLLDVTKSNLAVHEDVNRVPYVKGATERFVASEEEVLAVLDEGKNNRKVASTNMNADSSRSHSIFLINVKQEDTKTETKLTGKLYLVDLAGSEKVGKTGAEGETLEEAKNINKSLSALGNVISALAEGVKTHIPYRDSKMTRVLQDSLGGNCKTTIIICCSPSAYNEAETKSTLLFGTRAKSIKNSVQANVELTAEQWRKKFEREEAKAKKYQRLFQMAEEELQKWRAGETISEADQIDFSSSAAALAAYKEKHPESATSPTMSPTTNPIDVKMTSSSKSNINDNKSDVLTPKTTVPNKIATSSENVDDLYRQMDDKDEQIEKITQLNEILKQQKMELEDLYAQAKVDHEANTGELNRMQQENEISKSEVAEVLSALEELAVNYDQKQNQLERAEAKVDDLANDLGDRQNNLTKIQTELASATELSDGYKLRASEMLAGLLQDIYDFGLITPSQLATGIIDSANGELTLALNDGHVDDDIDTTNSEGYSKIENEFTAARLLVSKVKSEVQVLQERCDKQTSSSTTAHKELDEKNTELKETKQKLHHHENRVNTLSSCIKDVEAKRRVLEDNVLELQQEISRLRSQEQARLSEMSAGDGSHNNKNDTSKDDIAAALETQKQQFKIQSDSIRQEMDQKQEKIDKLEEIHSNLEAELQTINTENDLLKTKKIKIEEKLSTMQALNDKRSQARSDLRGLEETVTREIGSLHNLRKVFVKELTERAKKVASNANGGETDNSASSILSDFGGSQVQKQRIQFLESNLDQLTKVHKTLVRDNSDLRSELPKLEKKLRVTAERVKNLEQALRDAKDGACRDRKRYQQEVDRIKETVRSRYHARKAQIGAQIARPIRAGHPPPGASYNTPVGIRGGGTQIRSIRGSGGQY